jgi:uncharacterized protein YbjT (DUF2867 family)
MKKILVVGATGQLGSEIIRQVRMKSKFEIHALVRPASNYQHLKGAVSEFVIGDLKDKKAC